MTRRTINVALFALFIGGSVAVPLRAQTQEEAKPAPQEEVALERTGDGVTVRVMNDSWSHMRIYVFDTVTQRPRWRIGEVNALSRATFEVPDHIGAQFNDLVLVAFPLASSQAVFTQRLTTWPGSQVDWRLNVALNLSFATIS